MIDWDENDCFMVYHFPLGDAPYYQVLLWAELLNSYSIWFGLAQRIMHSYRNCLLGFLVCFFAC